MPYVITTTSPDPCVAYSTPRRPVVSRHAVATLEDARIEAARVIPEHASVDVREHPITWRHAHTLAATLPESGGTVGPLPDGTTIEVTWTTWDRLRDELRHAMQPLSYDSGHAAEAIIAAYNAAPYVQLEPVEGRMKAAVHDIGTAWSFIGFDPVDDDGREIFLRIKGGRALYEEVHYDDGRGGKLVRLGRLDVIGEGLHPVVRYVDPDTIMEVVKR